MNILKDICMNMSGWMRPYVPELAMALVCTVLVIYGETLNRLVKSQIKSQPFFIRFGLFVVICAFGYGLMTVFLTSTLSRFLGSLDKVSLAPVVILTFVVLGFIADRERHI